MTDGHFLGQAIGGGEARGPGADHEHFGIDAHGRATCGFMNYGGAGPGARREGDSRAVSGSLQTGLIASAVAAAVVFVVLWTQAEWICTGLFNKPAGAESVRIIALALPGLGDSARHHCGDPGVWD